MDFDGSGSVDIVEFKEAISFVNKVQSDSTHSFGDEQQINRLFREMDSDGNGAVDLNEFMTAMTGQLSSGLAGSDRELAKLNSAFFEFAKAHKRGNFLEKIKRTDISDSSKVEHFIKLFQIQHVTAEKEERTDVRDLKILQKMLNIEKRAVGRKVSKR